MVMVYLIPFYKFESQYMITYQKSNSGYGTTGVNYKGTFTP